MSVPEKRKRLILESSDSDLDEYFISPRSKSSKEDAPIDQNQVGGAVVEQMRIENLSICADESNNGFVENQAVRSNKEKFIGTELVKKRKGEFSNGEIDATRARIKSAKDSKGLKLGVPPCRYEREEVRAGNFVSEKKKDLKQNLKKRCMFAHEAIKRTANFDPVKANGLKLNSSHLVAPTNPASKNLCMNGERSSVDGSIMSVELPECPSSTENTNSTEISSRRGDVSTSGTSIPANKRISRLNKGRSEVKKKVKDQIRSMLFEAGWSIELRPRRNRDYEDSVYVSPQGTGYWSITKAYAAFQENQKSNNSSIAVDALEMLKRNVRNKRGYKARPVEASREAKWNMRKRPHGDDGMDNYTPYEWKRTVLSWLIDKGLVSENSKVKYMNVRRNKMRLKGRIRRDGIYCSCCSKILSVHKFELHAGSKEKQAYDNIYVEELGVSLTQCLLDAWKKQGEGERKGFHEVKTCSDDASDDTCGICGDGGDLICCDGCPSTFHMVCLGIQVLPPGDWHCRNCLCKFCKLSSCSEKQESDTSCSALLTCRQCGQKYHEDCMPEKDAVCKKIGSGQGVINSFCGLSCRKLYRQLQRLLGVRNEIEGGFSWTVVRRLDESSPRYLQRLSQVAICNSKIAVAFNVMDDCFLPITDQRTGIDLIHNVIYNCGSNFSRLDFGGFYTFILERGDEIISAASVRIHGRTLAEMPFIGTRNIYRQQGMCRRLLGGIESALCSLNVKKLVIPAISEMKSTWTNAFRFNNLDRTQRKEINSLNLVFFPDTGLLQKILLAEPSDGLHASTIVGSTESEGKDKDVRNVNSHFQKLSEVGSTLLRQSMQDANGEQNLLEENIEMP
ncbi:hypothetical protein LUZ63_001049 [Rhynchospora breviuscula]|uniref:PHD-type domain-containing protein n=1 Tax=Rhynchospora breviuscula TaxID=2022672 RepID=A0A9Q0CWM7_9POAL|nr:hypothetical protein LUZ63_001049 [Rhynchospora breviuscula]